MREYTPSFSHFLLAVALGAILALALGINLHAASAFSGVTTCPTSGAKQVSSSSLPFSYGIVQALVGNSGTITVGGSNVTSSNGIYITPIGSVSYPPQGNSNAYNLGGIYFTCSNSADSLSWTVFK